jgi:hypothetical protein
MLKRPGKMAFDFILEKLDRLGPVARPMFGCHAVYVGEKLVLVTRDKNGGDNDNGVWIATTSANHESLKRELPSLRSIAVLGNGQTNWQIIPKDSAGFEEEVSRACELVLRNDFRIGTIPKGKGGKTSRKPTRRR